MSNRKIKVFLGAYINNTNAQNLNCLALAQHLDKDLFEVYTLELYSGNLESQQGKLPGVNIFNCFKPFRISQYIGYLRGIWKCDIAYLPKGEIWKFNRTLLKLLNKKSFSTVEGIFDDDNLKSALQVHKSYENFMLSKKHFDKVFSITNFLGKYNFKKHKIISAEKTLYLGCELETFKNSTKKFMTLNTIAYIGRLKRRKGIFDFLEIAGKFPSLKFIVLGNGEDMEEVDNYILMHELRNLNILGTVSHKEMAIELSKVQLHILPSRSEGFPKVTLETAAAGVPSIVYSNYGANEWITHSKNGFVVDTLEQMIETVQLLIENPDLLQLNSKNAIALAQSFDWSIVVKEWEQEILKIYNS